MDKIAANQSNTAESRTWGEWAHTQAASAWHAGESIASNRTVQVVGGAAVLAAGAYIGRGKIAEAAEAVLPKATELLESISGRAAQSEQVIKTPWNLHGLTAASDGALAGESEGTIERFVIRDTEPEMSHSSLNHEWLHGEGPGGDSIKLTAENEPDVLYHLETMGKGLEAAPKPPSGAGDDMEWTLHDGNRAIPMKGADSHAYNEIMKDYKWKYPDAKIHPDALVDVPTENIGLGTVIKQGAEVTDRATVGKWATVGEGSTISGRASVGDGVKIGKDVTIENNASVGPRVVIKDGAILQNYAAVGDSSTIGEGAILKDHVTVGMKNQVGPGAQVKGNAVLGDNVWVGHHARVVDNAEVGAFSDLGDKSIVGGNSKLSKLTSVEDGLHLNDYKSPELSFVFKDTVSGETRSRKWTAGLDLSKDSR